MGKKPLHYLIKNANTKTVKLLLDYKADINVKCKKGFTPIFNAVLGGNIYVVQLLIDSGSNINKVSDTDKFTPLHVLCAHSKKKITMLDYLLKNGADVNIKDVDGHTPLNLLLYVLNI